MKLKYTNSPLTVQLAWSRGILALTWLLNSGKRGKNKKFYYNLLNKSHRNINNKCTVLKTMSPVGGGAFWLVLHLPDLCWGFTGPKE